MVNFYYPRNELFHTHPKKNSETRSQALKKLQNLLLIFCRLPLTYLLIIALFIFQPTPSLNRSILNFQLPTSTEPGLGRPRKAHSERTCRHVSLSTVKPRFTAGPVSTCPNEQHFE